MVVEREGRGGAQAEESTEEGGGNVGQHDDHATATGLVLVERVCAVVLLRPRVGGIEDFMDDWAPVRFSSFT